VDLPIPSSSIIVFILTFCVGYVTLLIAYSQTDRLSEWFSLDVFDKTIQTFIVGGLIAIISFVGLGAPVLSLMNETTGSYNLMLDWLSRNFGMMVLVECLLILVVALCLSLYLERISEIAIEYVS